MLRYLKAFLIGVAFFIGLYLGSSYEENKYREILVSTQKEHITKLDEVTKRKDATINLLLKDMATTDALQSALDKRINRLQYSINSGNKAIMQHTDRVTAESVITCRQLLSEGAELHGEGVKILRDTNRRLEAIINLHKNSSP
jgi:uncharacterized protein YlxW (UPF0749 family)